MSLTGIWQSLLGCRGRERFGIGDVIQHLAACFFRISLLNRRQLGYEISSVAPPGLLSARNSL
jgi:hypothetical protein